ncbi:MAG TPA: nucleotidyltransferase family protein [Casimicrobiaceae bacterium]|jgi:NDP-sugar pyrophosphorylase family protein
MLSVAILCGGLAMRLRPITATIPKSLVQVAGEPFVVHQLRYLRKQGVSRVVLCVSYLGEQIVDVAGDGSAFGLDVGYSHDGPELLGTGGALKRALSLLGDSFFVLYGDSYLPIDFGEVERSFFSAASPALMTVLRNEDRWDKSNVRYEKGVIFEYNKRKPDTRMEHIDYGLSVVSGEALVPYPDASPFDLADVFHDLSAAGRLAGFEVFERFYEIGSPQGLTETADYLASQR